VHLQPEEAFFAELLAIAKEQHASVDIGAHVIEVWRDRVDTATEIALMREVEFVNGLETLSYSQSEQPLAAQAVAFLVALMLLEELELLTEWGLPEKLRCNRTIIVPFRDASQAASN